MLSSIFKSGREDMCSLFSNEETGRPIFRSIMPLKRFQVLLQCLRFDDPESRRNRTANDPAAAKSYIFEVFIKNCQKIFCVAAISG